jgi:DNA-binding NarL/FixJ family response regulator
MNSVKRHIYDEKDKAQILIIDDHPIVREGLAHLINQQSDLIVCAEAGNTKEALKAIEEQSIDLALVDMLLKNTTGTQVTNKIKSLNLDIPVLIFSMSDEPFYIKRALDAGARGYITKDEVSEKIIYAIRQVLKGKVYLSKRLAKKFSKRELEGFLSY